MSSNAANEGPPIRRLYLVDGSGYIFRAFHALPPMNRPDGAPTNAVFGFTNMILKLVDDSDADAIAVIFDAGRKTFRNDIYPAYKAHRPPPPEELIPQFDIIRQATRAFSLPCIEMPGFEADDLIATFARMAETAGAEVTIVSSDKDLMQLVTARVSMFDPMKNRAIGFAEVEAKFGVGPDRVIDVQALAGDSSDNVPGVPGIGVKTAARLINEYGDLDKLLARAEEIKQPKRRQNLIEHADLARISRDLVTLRDDAPVAETLDDFRRREPDPDALLGFLREQDFKRTVARYESLLGAHGAEAPAGAPQAPPDQTAYELVVDMAVLDRWIAEATRLGVVAIDTETTGLDAMQADLVGVSMAVEPGRACYIPLAHRGPGDLDPAPEHLDRDAALARLRPLLADPGVLKVAHNLKYDALLFKRHGLDIVAYDDTMLLSYVLDAGLNGHGLDELADLHLDHSTIKFSDVAGSGRNQVTFDRVPLDKARDYAAEDADICLRLHRVFRRRLIDERMVTVYETLERPLVGVIVDMERAGVLLDKAALSRLSMHFQRRIDALEKEIVALAGRPFNIASPKQLGEILFDELGMPGGRKGKTSAYGTGADVLEGLAAQGFELPKKVLDWRLHAKLKSTYTDALQAQINPETGRVHTSYAMAIAQTGRLSSTDPNLQNIPVRAEEGRRIREAFVAPTGCKLISLDYSQIELRLLAHVADIQPLKQAFHDGVDIHALTASQVFGVPLKDMDSATRRRAKAINFGIIYGISAFGLARNLGIDRSAARDYINAYFRRFPGIKDYMEAMKDECRRQGHVKTIFGRKIHLPAIHDKNPARRSFAERQAINAPLQGAAADIIKRAMIRIPPALSKAGLGARMLMQVHDELVFEAPRAEADKTIGVARAVMESAAEPALRLDVPIRCDAGVGDMWAAAH